MPKKRSKRVGSNQGVVSHNISLTTPITENLTQKSSFSFLPPSINLFSSFSPKVFPDSETAVVRPNSTSDFKSLFSFKNPFFSSRKPKTCCLDEASKINYCPWGVGRDFKPVGLAIVDAIRNDEADQNSSLAENRIVFLGSHLKVQIPSINQNSCFSTQMVESPRAPVEFGVKDRNLASTIPIMENSPRALRLSASEIELSEDYTCVISHGPQQKTTHIFDNFIIESCSSEFSSLREVMLSTDQFGCFTSDYFMAICHTCRKKIAQGNDIFICRGDKAFCSQECRNGQITWQE